MGFGIFVGFFNVRNLSSILSPFNEGITKSKMLRGQIPKKEADEKDRASGVVLLDLWIPGTIFIYSTLFHPLEPKTQNRKHPCSEGGSAQELSIRDY